MSNYKPAYTITTKIVKLTSKISELISNIKHIDKYSTLKLDTLSQYPGQG